MSGSIDGGRFREGGTPCEPERTSVPPRDHVLRWSRTDDARRAARRPIDPGDGIPAGLELGTGRSDGLSDAADDDSGAPGAEVHPQDQVPLSDIERQSVIDSVKGFLDFANQALAQGSRHAGRTPEILPAVGG